MENVEAPYRIRVADFGVTSAKAEPSDEQRVSLSPRRVRVCVFITAVPITKLFAWGEGIVEDMCYERRRAEACVD